MISAPEFAPQNKPHTEEEEEEEEGKTFTQQHHQAFALFQKCPLIFIDLTRLFLPPHHQPQRSQLLPPPNFIVIPSEDDYLTLSVTLPACISSPFLILSHTLNTLEMNVFSSFCGRLTPQHPL
ncbi:Hypothetical predicted protein [Xyrichtys novacula]|uniref:Uncharacterized protein n=1 Tax=Xyrichtys novacula TaxID=13765 RepID=A0AAV1F562_XYRNO|nr:Hypothetical predicted protein [Xyrichtys novacula]